MIQQTTSAFSLFTDDHAERSILQVKADLLILLTMDYAGGKEGLKHFALDNNITIEQARAMLTGQLNELNIDLLLTCLHRKGYELTRHMVHDGLLNMRLAR